MKTMLMCPCGQLIEGQDEDELVRNVQAHLRERHEGREYTREQILFMAH